jgi:outer membrane protein, heavy metal efflux system
MAAIGHRMSARLTSSLIPPRRGDRGWSWLRTAGALLGLLVIAGCATYRPQPLDDQTVTAALAPPDAASVLLLASSIHHPVLKPVTLDLAAPWGPAQVALVAVVINPGLKALRRGRALAQAQVLQAGILPNPQLSLTLDHPVGGADGGAVNALGAGLTWEVTALFGRDARIAAAQEAADEVAIDVAWQEWQVAMAARLAATRLVALAAQVDQCERILAVLLTTSDRVTAAATSGLLLDGDRVQAEAAAHDASITLTQFRHDRDRQRLLLTQALGLPPGTPVRLDGPAFSARPIGDARRLAALWSTDLRHRRLDLLALAKGYQSGEESLRAAILAQFPRISLGLQLSRDNTNVVSSGFGLVIDLPIFDRNQGVIAADQATRDKLFDEYIDRLAGARNDLALAAIDCDSAAERLATARAHAAAARAWSERQRAAAAAHHTTSAEAGMAGLAELQAALEVLLLEQQQGESTIAFELAAGSFSPTAPESQAPTPPSLEKR